jgi:hypothetical protein
MAGQMVINLTLPYYARVFADTITPNADGRDDVTEFSYDCRAALWSR